MSDSTRILAGEDSSGVSSSGRGTLRVELGICCEQGRRDENQDFTEARIPRDGDLDVRGITAVVADGMAGALGGRVAAELAVRHFIDFYYQMPETFGVARAANSALRSINSWIHAQGRSDPELTGMATTFSALILRGRRAHVVHVGDTRIYRLRENDVRQITQDHTSEHPDMRHVLLRAVGLEDSVRVDIHDHSLRLHDRFLITCDGVHDTLGAKRIKAMLCERLSPRVAARRFVEAAIEAGSQDNATALVIDVVDLPAPDRESLTRTMDDRPLLELPETGDEVDGFELEEILSDGRYSRIFVARDIATDDRVALKFPHPRATQDTTMRSAFVREAWIAGQVRSPFVGEVIELPEERYSRLYTCMPLYRGKTLEQRLLERTPLSLNQGVLIGTRIAKAAYALHRRKVIHRDIKPENVILEDNGGLKLLDLGVALLPDFPELIGDEIPGTPSFMAPELCNGEPGSERSDVYALGVTMYRAFSRQYPYGEVEAFSRPRFEKYIPLSRRRPDLPAWLDQVIATATAVDPDQRYRDTIEFAFDLENGIAKGGQVVEVRVPLFERNPLLLWKLISLALGVALLASLLIR